MLEPVKRASEDCPPFVPDDLLVVLEADSQKPVEDLAGKLAGVPHVSQLQGGHQLERFAPIGPRIA